MTGLGRTLLILGFLLIAAGLVAIVCARMNLPLGRLPGDLSWRGRNWSVSFPLATCLLISVVLSLLFWAINHFGGSGAPLGRESLACEKSGRAGVGKPHRMSMIAASCKLSIRFDGIYVLNIRF